jgi:hypothetical protein
VRANSRGSPLRRSPGRVGSTRPCCIGGFGSRAQRKAYCDTDHDAERSHRGPGRFCAATVAVQSGLKRDPHRGSATLYAELAKRDAERSTHAALVAELKAKQLKIDPLTHEMAILKRYRFDRRSEQMDVLQRSLLDESIDADIEAISLELETLNEKPASPPKEQPRRVALPAGFPRREIRHEPGSAPALIVTSIAEI